MSISSSGVITWTPTEVQGPGSYPVTVTVSDGSLTASRGFTVTVNEVNVAPVLAAIADRTNAELSTLTLTNTATDVDFPANTLTFSLVSGPAGVSVDGATGGLTWTPTEAQGPSTNVIVVKVADDGTPSLSSTQSFTVVVTEVNAAPTLAAISDQTINELATLTVNTVAADEDVPVQILAYSLSGAPAGMSISSSGVITWTPTEVQGPGSYPVTVTVSDGSLTASRGFTVTVNEVNVAPVLAVIANRTNAELSTLTLTNTATDVDFPTNTLTFSLVSGPAGVSVDGATGVLTWTPTEAQGPSTNVIVVKVADDGTPSLSSTQSFTVVVTEVNAAPTLAVISDQTINELATLTVNTVAADEDVPVQILAYSLSGAPAGMSISSSGVITWTPTEVQGPGSYPVTVTVSDGSLTASRGFTVTVNEVNVAPVLAVIANRTNAELSTLTLTNTATDVDFPANTLTFSLVSGPAGVSVDGATGVLTWTPTEAQGPSTNVIVVKVADDGTPSLSSTQSFTVVVTEVNAAPTLAVISDQTINELATLTVNTVAADEDVPVQTLAYSLSGAPAGMSISSSGVITWTPTEVQGPGSYPVTVTVSDG